MVEVKEKKAKAEKTPKVVKEKKAKPVKAAVVKPVKIMSDELEKLERAKDTLAELIAAKKAADIAELELESAKGTAKDRKGAAATARLKVNQIIEEYERPLMAVFARAEKKAQTATIAKAAVDAFSAISDKHPRDAVEIEITMDATDVHPSLTVGTRKTPWGIGRDGADLLFNGVEVFVPKAKFAVVVGVELVHECLLEKPDTVHVGAADWESWLRSKIPAVKPNTAWEALPISEIGVAGKMAEKLADAGIATLGELSKAQARGEWWAEKIKGIGPGAAEKIGDGWIAFWARRPEFCEA